MYYLVQGYLTILLEMICCKIFFETFLKTEQKNSTIKSIGVPVLLSVILFIPACFFERVSFLKQIFVLVVITLIMKWYNGKTLKRNVVLTIIFESIILVVDYITIICCKYIIPDTNQISFAVQMLMVIIAKTILFLVVILIKNAFDKKEMEHFSDSQWIKFLFFPIFTICITLATISSISGTSNGRLEEILLFIAFGLVGMNIVVFYLLRDAVQREKKIHNNKIFEIHAKNQLELYKTIVADEERQRRLSHEYMNQIECIQALCETEQYAELREYLHGITGKILHDIDCIDTNNAIVNAVLNVKYQEAVNKGIVMICKINDLSDIHINSQDIVLILSNLLNNAIEACEKCFGQKMIKLKIIHEGKQLIISVKNTYDGKIIYENGVIQTSKKDSKHHGMGVQNVIEVVEKNKGYYVIKPTEKEFYISIIISESSMQ